MTSHPPCLFVDHVLVVAEGSLRIPVRKNDENSATTR